AMGSRCARGAGGSRSQPDRAVGWAGAALPATGLGTAR
nr:hypothetical protein [Tanacetum cinerariifolium]